MNILSYLRVEQGRLFRSKTTLLILALTLLCPLAGYSLYQPAGTTTTAAVALANPVLASGLGGAVLFALLTLFELDRMKRNQTEVLTDSIVSPLVLGAVKLVALLMAALSVTLLTAIVYLPYTFYRMNMVFDFVEYSKSVVILMLPSLWLSILASSAFYQIFRRVDLSFILLAALVYFSLSKLASDIYLLRWINPLVPTFSSDFSNEVVYRTAGYSRLVWFALLLGLWLFSLLCVRHHGKGLFGSLAHNGRKIYVPIIAVLLVAGSFYLYANEPYIDHAPMAEPDTSDVTGGGMSVMMNEQKPENQPLKVLHKQANIVLNTARTRLDGTAIYQIQNTSHQRQKGIMNLNPGYKVDKIAANGKEIAFTDLNNDYYLSSKDINFELPADESINLEITYGGSPKIPSADRMVLRSSRIDPKYIDIMGNALIPALNAATAEDCDFSGEVTIPGDLELISTGTPATVLRSNGDGTRTWQVHDPRGRATLFAGDYAKLEINTGGTPVFFYYGKKHQKQLEELGIRKILEDTIAYCTEHFGPLPYTKEMPLMILMSHAYSFGGGAAGNISFMDESTYTKESLSDPQKGASATEVLAHEIVHQWWGIGRFMMDQKNQDWSSEGLTVYTTYRMMKEKHGDEYANKYYVDFWKNALENQKSNFYVRHPEYIKLLPEKYVAQLQNMMWDAAVYKKVPLQILKAEQQVGGEKKMDKILAELFQNGGKEMPPMVTWHDFLSACGLTEKAVELDILPAGSQEGAKEQ
ncbi:M1 family aminopeptidase [Paenibacillus puldeungensis]|uniref:M1 family aminopeptidase n=1 Tax=Paenibacillus puldeungensis TaxID=696536 RepID=A0ABW3S221_9BACL